MCPKKNGQQTPKQKRHHTIMYTENVKPTCSLYWSAWRLSSSTCNTDSLYFFSSLRLFLARRARSLRERARYCQQSIGPTLSQYLSNILPQHVSLQVLWLQTELQETPVYIIRCHPQSRFTLFFFTSVPNSPNRTIETNCYNFHLLGFGVELFLQCG